MKRTGREKTKVFRTLIRCIRMSDKPTSKDISERTAREKREKLQERPPFFFGR